MQRVGNGRIEVDFIALSDDTEEAELAQMDGVAAVPMSSGDTLYLGAVFKVGDKKLAINYFDYKRAALLEYDVALQISNLSREATPRIGVLSSFLKPKNATEPHSSFSILEELKNQYDVTVIPHFAEALPKDIDVLVVIDTPILRRGMLVAIDKHIAVGSGTLLLVDPYQRMNEANASLAIQASKDGEINTLIDLLSFYGVEMAGDKIVGDDLNPSLVRSSSGKAYPFPYWMELGPDNISKDHPASLLLNKLLFADAGHFEIAAENKAVHSIVYTSTQTAELAKHEIKKQAAEQLAAHFVPESHPPRNLVVYIDGPVEPAFGDGGVEVNSRNASLFAVADADWIYNGYSMSEAQVGGATMPRPINDNFSLFLNIVEYLAGDERLLAIRSNGNPVRSFERVEEMLNKARRTYREREADYLAQISKAESSIAEVMRLTGAASRDQLPDDLQQQVMQLQALAYPIKRNLRALRQRMRKNVNVLFRNIVIFNFACGPILVIGMNIWLRRRRRQSRLA
jgi:ABC-2 type transport system permease protein